MAAFTISTIVITNKKILALDYGERRIGVAISDPTWCIAQGLRTIVYTNISDAVERVSALMHSHEIDRLVIGMPLTMKGEKAYSANKVEGFVELLRGRIEIPIITWDERLTTVAAHRTLTAMGKAPSKHREKLNEISAVLLLQSYLDSVRGQSGK